MYFIQDLIDECNLVLTDYDPTCSGISRRTIFIDIEFMERLMKDGIPMAVIFTKADKLKDLAAQRAFEEYENTLKAKWGDTPNLFISSAESQLGKERLLQFISTIV
jgi:GTP-binding protein